MRQLFSKSWKRIVAFMLALTLVIGCTGGLAVRAASSDMSVDSVLNFEVSNHWRFNFNMNGTWPTNGALDAYTNKSVTVTIKNASGETLATAEGSTLETHKNGPYWLLAIWGAHTGSNAPAVGDTITISSGQLAYANDANKIVNFAEETVLRYDGANWSVYEEQTIEEMSVDSVLNFEASNHWRFNFNMNGTWPTNGALDAYTNKSVTVTIKNASGETLATAEGSTLETHKNGPYWLLAIWGAHTGSNAPAVGDTITISSGQLAYANDANKIVNFAEETVLRYDGANWSVYEEQIPGIDMTITGIGQALYTGGHWRFWLNTSAELPTGTYSGIQVEVNGIQYVSDLDVINDAGMLMVALWGMTEQEPANGTTVTFKAGTGTNENGNINITEDYVVEYRDGVWVEEGFVVTPGAEMTITGIGQTAYTIGHWRVWLNTSAQLPAGTYSGMKVEVNGSEYVGDLEVLNDAGMLLVVLWGMTEPVMDDTTITLKAGTGVNPNGNITITRDCTLYANEYGWSINGFKEPLKVSQTGALLTLDKDTVFGGNEKGLYLNTNDTFQVDTTWATRIKAVQSDANSGVFYNGTKVDAPLIRYFEGKLYVGLADAGIAAKDKDKVTIKGTFELDGYGVSYKEVSFYYNGKIWGTTYEEAKPESYTKIAAESVNNVSSWNEKFQRWDVYLNVNAMLPGEIDKIGFNTLEVQVNGNTIDTTVYHSYQDTLFFPIEGQYLAKNCKDGTKITLKAGKALAADRTTGIELTKDFTFYTYKGSFTDDQPTSNTSWQKITVISMNTTAAYNEAADAWNVHLKLKETLVTESGTVYLDLPISINGKSYTIKALQDGVFLMLNIPGTILPGNTKKATIAIEAGAKAYANGGKNGVQFQEAFQAYVFNGVISEQEFDEVEEYEARIVGLQNALEDGDRYHVYLRLNKEFPGTAWYEIYDDFVYYYNGKKIETSARKSESSNSKFMYFGVEKSVVGTPKDGDIIKIAANTVMTCGGYRMTITNDFLLMYEDGLWSQYVETDVKAPEDNKSLWEIARFDKNYIPTTEDGSVLYSNEDKYNRITSIEQMKDFTVSFNAKKVYDDETTPSFGVILRGNAISEDEEMTENLLNGYVITFSALEMKESEDSNEEGIWTGYLSLWKNGVNYSLLDQYRISYIHDKSDHPYFQYDVDYNYEFSIYNITETCVCITVKVNDKLVMRYYDEAGSDPFDPAVNTGTFQVFAGCPNYVTDDIAELTEIISEKDECLVGDKVRVAATYPSVIEGAVFTVDKASATVEDGVFVATKPGTYTITGTYNGKELSAKTIVVTEAERVQEEEASTIPMIPIIAAAVLVVAAGAVAIVLLGKRKKKREEL